MLVGVALVAGIFCAQVRPVAVPAPAPLEAPATEIADVRHIFLFTNRQRAAQSLQPLAWDEGLARAARAHATRMAAAGTLSHRYPDEPELGTRAATAGAQFTSIAENIGGAGYAPQIEDAWMHSVAHRTNILDPRMNAIGIAIVPAHGTLYAVEDFGAAMPQLTREAAEERVHAELQAAVSGASLARDVSHTEDARRLCEKNGATATWPALLSITWQGADLDLPQPLVDALHAGKYTSAAVGACQATDGAFTVYRVHVSLY